MFIKIFFLIYLLWKEVRYGKHKLKGGDNNMSKIFCTTKKEVEHFIQCANVQGRDNVLFCDEHSNKSEVFLLLHGSSNGKVLFNRVLRTLKEVFQELKKRKCV